MTWTVINKPNRGRTSRDKPAVVSGERSARLVFPEDMVTAKRADLLHDGNGRLAIRMSNDGGRSLFKTSPSARTISIALPKKIREIFPLGTTDVDLVEEDGMLVLDLSQFSAPPDLLAGE